jgi:hypothetical protein
MTQLGKIGIIVVYHHPDDLDLAESYDGGRSRFDGPSSSTPAAPSAIPCG